MFQHLRSKHVSKNGEMSLEDNILLLVMLKELVDKRGVRITCYYGGLVFESPGNDVYEQWSLQTRTAKVTQ